jgi:hypothetical protein
MRFPGTRAEMQLAGYSLNEYTRCRGCKRLMEFWNTPNGKRVPMNPMPEPQSAAVSHFSDCPEAQQFRKPPQPSLFAEVKK